MPWPDGVMRSWTTRWRRWFCSAVRNGLRRENIFPHMINTVNEEIKIKIKNAAQSSSHNGNWHWHQMPYHSSVWRDLRDSVSFSWHAICKTDLLLHTAQIKPRLQIQMILTNFVSMSLCSLKTLPKTWPYTTSSTSRTVMNKQSISVNIDCFTSKDTFKITTAHAAKNTFHSQRKRNFSTFITVMCAIFSMTQEGSGNPVNCRRMWMMKLTTTDCRSRKTLSGRKVTGRENKNCLQYKV